MGQSDCGSPIVAAVPDWYHKNKRILRRFRRYTIACLVPGPILLSLLIWSPVPIFLALPIVLGAFVMLAITGIIAGCCDRPLTGTDIARRGCWLVMGSGLSMQLWLPLYLQLCPQIYKTMGYLSIAMLFGGPLLVLILSIIFQPSSTVAQACCPKCGYDLRGLPEPRCPECGTPFERKPDNNVAATGPPV